MTTESEQDALEAAVRQAARQRRRGDYRRAMLLLRDAAFQAENNAGLWTRYALSCESAGKRDEAKKAFAQAIWLQERAGRVRGADVTRKLEQLVDEGALPKNYARSGKTHLTPFALRSGGSTRVQPARTRESWHPYHKVRSRKKTDS